MWIVAFIWMGLNPLEHAFDYAVARISRRNTSVEYYVQLCTLMQSGKQIQMKFVTK
jgi:hypothetical protein